MTTNWTYTSLINISPWDKLGDVHVCDQTSEKQEWCSDSSHFPTKKRMLKKIRIESKTSSWIFLNFFSSSNMNDSIMGVLFTKYTLLVNPLSPNVHIQILQPDLHTSPLRISWENLIKDHGIFSMMIILLILITLSLDSVWILLGENCCWSLLGLKV